MKYDPSFALKSVPTTPRYRIDSARKLMFRLGQADMQIASGIRSMLNANQQGSDLDRFRLIPAVWSMLRQTAALLSESGRSGHGMPNGSK